MKREIRRRRAQTLPGGRRIGLQLLLAWIATMLSQLFGVLLAVPVALGRGLDPFGLFEDPIPLSVFMFGYAAVALLAYWGLLRWLAPNDWRITFHQPGQWRELWLGIGVGALLITLGVGVVADAGVFQVLEIGPDWGILGGIAIGVGAAFGEEAFFRGFLLRILNARFGSTIAVVSVSLVFGLIHLGNQGATLWGGIALVLSAGALLNASYLLTNRWWLPVGLHLGWNATMSGLFGIDVSGSGSGRGLLASQLVGPEWLTGGSMGLEGSVPLVLIAVTAGVVLIVLAIKRGKWRGLRVARAELAAAKSALRAVESPKVLP